MEPKGVIQGWYDADQIRKDIIEVCRVQIVLAVICGISRPCIYFGVMDFRSEGDITKVVRACIRGELVLEEFWSYYWAALFASYGCKRIQVHAC